jgi:hypothetical protein
MSEDAFYARTGETTFEPTPATVGPWDPGLQHGGPIAALLTTAFDATAPRPGTRVGHFALEFLSPVAVAPMRVATEIVRPGKKVELLAATATVGERIALRASAWRIATEAGRCPTVNLDEPPPPLPATAATPRFPGVPAFGYGEALEWRFVSGGFDSLGPATAWTRMRVAVVRGEPVSPLVHAMAMVDSANGIASELDVRRFLFVPVNLTVSVARDPEGDWVGMSARMEIASEGAGTTHARLFDARGYFGQALQTLYVEPRRERA